MEDDRPLNNNDLEDLWKYLSQYMDFIDAQTARRCDGTLYYTMAWARQRLPADMVTACLDWLCAVDGGCDCNVITNVLPRYIRVDGQPGIALTA